MANNKKEISLNVGEDQLDFEVGLMEYESYQNDMVKSLVAPAKTFLKRCIKAEQKDKLKEYIDQGLALEMAGAVMDEFRPKVTISVKK